MYYNAVSMSQLSEIISGSRLVPSASYAITASYALTAQTLLGSVISASYALTSSYVENGGGESYWTASGADIKRVGDVIVSGTLFLAKTGSFGNSITNDNAIRALNLVSTDATMRILRVTPNIDIAAPSFELIHRTTPDGANTVWWDCFLSSSDAFVIRGRTSGDIAVGEFNTTGLRTLSISASVGLYTKGNLTIDSTTPRINYQAAATTFAGQLVLQPTAGNREGMVVIAPKGTSTTSSLILSDNQSVDTVGSNYFGFGSGFVGSVPGVWNFGSMRHSQTNANSMPIAFAVSNTSDGRIEVMRIDSTGRIGIGLTSPKTKLDILGNLLVTGSVTASGGFFGTASYALTSSYAITASYALFTATSSYALFTATSSYAITASYVSGSSDSSVSSSYSLTSSYSDFAVTASYVSGSSSISSSYSLSSSYTDYSVTASYALYAETSSYTIVTYVTESIVSSSYSDYAVTASYSDYAVTASYVSGSSSVSSSYSLSSSYADYSVTASYALTSSYADTSSYTSMSMGDINDVSLTGLQNGYVLSYDTGIQKWIPTAMSAGIYLFTGINSETFNSLTSSAYTGILGVINLFSFNVTETAIEVI